MACNSFVRYKNCGGKEDVIEDLKNCASVARKFESLENSDNPEIVNKLAFCLSNTGDQADREKANDFYEGGVKAGNATSAYYLALNLEIEARENQDPNLFKLAAKNYEVSLSLPSPKNWSKNVSDHNMGVAHLGAAESYRSILDLQKNINWENPSQEQLDIRGAMIKHLQEGAATSPESAFKLAEIYSKGAFGIKEDLEQAKKLYESAKSGLESEYKMPDDVKKGNSDLIDKALGEIITTLQKDVKASSDNGQSSIPVAKVGNAHPSVSI